MMSLARLTMVTLSSVGLAILLASALSAEEGRPAKDDDAKGPPQLGGPPPGLPPGRGMGEMRRGGPDRGRGMGRREGRPPQPPAGSGPPMGGPRGDAGGPGRGGQMGPPGGGRMGMGMGMGVTDTPGGRGGGPPSGGRMGMGMGMGMEGMGPGGRGGPPRWPHHDWDDMQKNDPQMHDLLKADQDLEREAREMAIQYRRAPKPQREQIKERIGKLVNKHFEVRQERRELELKRLEEELDRLRGAIERRNEARDQLVGQRLSQLLGEDKLDF